MRNENNGTKNIENEIIFIVYTKIIENKMIFIVYFAEKAKNFE